jgi:hypothetical protein
LDEVVKYAEDTEDPATKHFKDLQSKNANG